MSNPAFPCPHAWVSTTRNDGYHVCRLPEDHTEPHRCCCGAEE